MIGKVPFLPRVLGLAGLLPQIACVAVLYFGPSEWREPATLIAFAYAALIFTFLGGTWWGIAASAPAAERRRTLGWVWIAAVLPSLIALAAFLPLVFDLVWPEPSLVALGGAILFSPLVDRALGPLAPRWWLALRVPLSLGLGSLTIAAALAWTGILDARHARTVEFGAEASRQPQPPHLEIRLQAPRRIGEGCRAVLLDAEMGDPGEEVARDRHRDEDPPVRGRQCEDAERDHESCADIMQRPRMRLGMFAQIKGPEFGEGRIGPGHARQLAFPFGIGQAQLEVNRLGNESGQRA